MTDAVWPDGAREAVTDVLRRDSVLGGMVPLEDQLLAALEPFVQQRIEAFWANVGPYEVLKCRNHWHVGCGGHELSYGTFDEAGARAKVAELNAKRRSDVDALRAEVARLRGDGERLRAAAVDAINAVSDPAMGHLFRAVDAYDAARSAPGEGA